MNPALQERLAPILGPALSAWAAGAFLTLMVGGLLFALRRLLVRRLGRLAARTTTGADDLLVKVIGRTGGWFLALLSLAAGSSVLTLGQPVARLREIVLVVALGVQAGQWLTTLLAGLLALRVSDPGTGGSIGRTAFGALRFLIQLGVWSGLTLLVLGNLGVDVTALVAGLGVGGIAVALAVQNVLSDLFASLSIVLDRPFEVGDFIVVDGLMGTVERVGLKTTRIRSLSGEQLVFSNANLLDANIRNYRRMAERRILFSIGVVYQTAPHLVEAIPGIIRAAVESAPLTRFDRAHFKEFGDSALVFEVVYFVLSPDFNQYMDVQQTINLALLRRFGARGIEFAYPTQMLYLSRTGQPEARPPLVHARAG